MLVRDVADDGFHQILDGHQPVYAAIFIDHQSEMSMGLPHLQQQIEHRDLRRDHQRLAQNFLDRKILRLAGKAEYILDMHHAGDVIEILAIHRHAGMAFLADQGQGLVQGDIHPHRHDIGAGNHHVIGGDVAQAQHIGDQRPLLRVQIQRFARRRFALPPVFRLLHEFRDGLPHRLLLAAQFAQQAGQRVAHRFFHGLGTPSRLRMRVSSASISLAAPGW